MTQSASGVESEFVRSACERIAADLGMITDRELQIRSVSSEVSDSRPAGRGQVHVSFRLGMRLPEGSLHGCLILPLAEAISLACFLMMVPDAGVESRRNDTLLDSATKDALLEVGNFVAGATEAALRVLGLDHVKVSAEGCQGVRAGVRPAFKYREGDPLLIGRATASLHEFPAFEMTLMVPRLCFAARA